MNRFFFILVCLSWLGLVHATTPGLPFGIRIDTAYVSNDLHIELEYSVLIPFGSVKMMICTSADDPAARQYANAPVALSRNAGTYRKRIPVYLPQDQITEILIHLSGDSFVNINDSAQYDRGVICIFTMG